MGPDPYQDIAVEIRAEVVDRYSLAEYSFVHDPAFPRVVEVVTPLLRPIELRREHDDPTDWTRQFVQFSAT